MHRPRLTLILAIDRTGDHISGDARVPGAPPLRFEGRLGLMAAIDALVAGDPEGASARTHDQEMETT